MNEGHPILRVVRTFEASPPPRTREEILARARAMSREDLETWCVSLFESHRDAMRFLSEADQ